MFICVQLAARHSQRVVRFMSFWSMEFDSFRYRNNGYLMAALNLFCLSGFMSLGNGMFVYRFGFRYSAFPGIDVVWNYYLRHCGRFGTMSKWWKKMSMEDICKRIGTLNKAQPKFNISIKMCKIDIQSHIFFKVLFIETNYL